VTSSRPGEGKSTTSLAIAQNFARLGLRTLIVDGDLRKPSLHKNLGVDNPSGFSSLLTGGARLDEVVRETDTPNLSAMTSGPLPPSPAELLAGGRLRAFLGEAQQAFDLVVIDGPPVMGLADAPMIGTLTGGTLLVIESGVVGPQPGQGRRAAPAHRARRADRRRDDQVRCQEGFLRLWLCVRVRLCLWLEVDGDAAGVSRASLRGAPKGAWVLVALVAAWLGYEVVTRALAERWAESRPERALLFRRDHPVALAALAERRLDGGRPQEAVRLARRALEAAPANVSALRTLALATERRAPRNRLAD
jgi:capsular exopolysaccharide synthesis family protein